ncbi:MAG TPA: TspO/MBR family protein [Dermatophilaceae bacterium]|nr:TspO/MBR family protein [Dermatophilaceae bacterium]
MTGRTGWRRFGSRGRDLAVATGAVVATAVAGGTATDPGGRWYRSLDLPPWQPPAPTFGLVWTPLYADLAVTSAAVATRLAEDDRPRERRAWWAALGVNLALNAGWSALFFRSHRPWLATVGAAALTASSADLARRAGASDPWHRTALLPYAAWCGFATLLTAEIWRRNPGRH